MGQGLQGCLPPVFHVHIYAWRAVQAHGRIGVPPFRFPHLPRAGLQIMAYYLLTVLQQDDGVEVQRLVKDLIRNRVSELLVGLGSHAVVGGYRTCGSVSTRKA